MTEILRFIVQYCSFLWSNGRYRIVESGVGSGFGDAYIVLESNAIRLTFVRDRGQLFLDVQRRSASAKEESYSIDLVRRLLTGVRQASAELDEGYARFLGESLDDIEAMFTDERGLPELRQRLHELMRVRTQDMFG